MILEKKEKKFYTSYSKLSEVKLITIGLASPERIKQWAEKTLPNGKILGEVINANTLHHKTFKPQKGGLFCERIFGPLKDFECACGKPLKYKKHPFGSRDSNLLETNATNSIKSVELNSNKSILGEVVTKTRNFCNTCEVEYTWSVMRRYQLGYIKLISPVTHVWYLKGNPSYLSILLDIKKRHLEYITYCSETLTLENALKGGAASSKSSDIVSSWNKLKQQIMDKEQEKTTNLNDKKSIQPNINLLHNKIEKREKLKLKKYKYWKQFYNEKAINTTSSQCLLEANTSPFFSKEKKEMNNGFIATKDIGESATDCYQFLSGPEIQLKSFKELGLKSLDAAPLNNKPTLKARSASAARKNYNIYSSWDSSKVQSENSASNFKNPVKESLKTYASKINFKKLKFLSIIISQAKQVKLNNGLEALMSNVAAKKIFKNLPIPFYILLNLNVFSQKSIYNNVSATAWQKLSEKALKKALTRINKIFNKIDSISFKQNWLDGFSNIETLNATPSIKNVQSGAKTYADALFYSSSLRDKVLYSDVLLDSNSSLKSLQDSFKSIKKFFYHLLELQNFGTHGPVQKKLISPYFKPNPKLKSKQTLFIKSHFFLEFYTLSNFPNSLANFIISNFLIKSALNIKTIKNNAQIALNNEAKNQLSVSLKNKTDFYMLLCRITKNLSEIFFQIFLKNGSAKHSVSARYKIKTLLKPIALNKTDKDKINKKNLNSFKKILGMFYLISNLNSSNLNIKKAGSSDNLSDLLLHKSDWTESFTQILNKNLVTKKVQKVLALAKTKTFNLACKDKFQEEKKFTLGTPHIFSTKGYQPFADAPLYARSTEREKKKLYNNIYCLSHRERWEVENDWNFLYYFMTAPCENGEIIIPNYKDRYENGYGTNFAAREYNATLTYQNISFNLQKSAFFSGPGIVQQLLNEFNFYEIKKMDKQNRILLYQLNKQIFKLKKKIFNRSAKKELKECYKKRDLLIRRTKLVRKLFIKESSPQATILTVLPVLPPDLRPIVKMGGQIAASDLNRLYQRVIYRNDRLKKFLKDPATSHSYEMKYAQRLLQEAVDNLIQNGKSGVVSEKDSRGRALKSLSDILKGKQGRFRQYLLGKRVDYSGRSVIVVGPKLKLHECGLPKEMALELYLPFLLKRILNENLARTVVGAKTLIKTNPSLIWELLREIMQTCPVLLNRAPTLHRLGIQAFQPKLIDGRAILLHPLVCSAFNADFDGDQMAVHVPITVEARAEAWKLMLSRNNILSPATGDPLAIPSQDMVLGCYYLTTNLLNSKTQNLSHRKSSGFYFSNVNHALKDYALQEIDLHSNIWLKWDGLIENGADQEEPIEIRMDSYGNWKEIYNKSQKSYNPKNKRSLQYILTTPGKILFNQIIQKSLT